MWNATNIEFDIMYTFILRQQCKLYIIYIMRLLYIPPLSLLHKNTLHPLIKKKQKIKSDKL